MTSETTINVRDARRLALARAGLLKPEWTGFPRRAAKQPRKACMQVIDAFGYLQLDTVAVAGARSHALVLMSRLPDLDPRIPETLLTPGSPVFEYWGHEASWLPMQFYPLLGFRREAFRESHPWWGELLVEHRAKVRDLLARIRGEGPLRSSDFEGSSGSGWWNLKLTKKLATALWSSGELAIRQRSNFQRIYDLHERVIPQQVRDHKLDVDAQLTALLLAALRGHGWASVTTLAATWRLRNRGRALRRLLAVAEQEGKVIACTLVSEDGTRRAGYIRPEDLALAHRLRRVRPSCEHPVLLSPFDPLLWDRERVQLLFGFHQILEIFKPPTKRIYGYYCMPVLAGECLVARHDLKADRRRGVLEVRSTHLERKLPWGPDARTRRSAANRAVQTYAQRLGLGLVSR